MFTILFVTGICVVLIFGFVVAFGAPFLPTLKVRTVDALELLDLKPGQTLLELGSGDGRILRAAAQQGVYAVGYELNPLLVLWSIVANWKYRSHIKVHWGNYWHHKLPPTDGIYVFLLDRYMQKLDTKIEQDMKSWHLAASEPPVRAHRTDSTAPLRASAHPSNISKLSYPRAVKLVSFAFEVPGKRPIRELNGLFLYKYN